MFKDRSTADILIIMISGTICAAVLLTGAGITLLAILQPDRDLSQSITALSSIVNVLLGLLAGFIAGRGSIKRDKNDRG